MSAFSCARNDITESAQTEGSALNPSCGSINRPTLYDTIFSPPSRSSPESPQRKNLPDIKTAGSNATAGMMTALERRYTAQQSKNMLQKKNIGNRRPNIVINQAFAGFTYTDSQLIISNPADIVINVREVMPKSRLFFFPLRAIRDQANTDDLSGATNG